VRKLAHVLALAAFAAFSCGEQEEEQKKATSVDVPANAASGDGNAGSPFRKGPYLVYPGTNTEMTVLWQARRTPKAGSTIEWGPTREYGDGPVSVAESGRRRDEHRFSHTITGLTPGTLTNYRVTVDGKQFTGSFLAAPDVTATSVTLYAYGDTRSSPAIHSRVTAAIMSDVEAAPAARQTFCLHCGDWVGNGDVEREWDAQYFDRSRPDSLAFMSRMPVMGCRGNHERDGKLLRKYWPYPYEDKKGCYYSFDYGPVHVTIVDQFRRFTAGSDQHEWLAADLAGSTREFKIVILHEPLWGAGTHRNDETTQSAFCPLFEGEGVDVVLAGHNHNYARCEVNGIQYVTTGGGGAPLYPVDATWPHVAAAASVHHFVRLAVEGDTITIAAFSMDGELIDSVDVVKTPKPGAAE
jgi:predicted phosphodiesterase